MKRDWELVRLILKEIAATAANKFPIHIFNFISHTPADIAYNVEILESDGLINGRVTSASPVQAASVFVTGLTWDGNELLDAMSDDAIWLHAQQTILSDPNNQPNSVFLLAWLNHEKMKSLGLVP